jgi:hypothetical protein
MKPEQSTIHLVSADLSRRLGPSPAGAGVGGAFAVKRGGKENPGGVP